MRKILLVAILSIFSTTKPAEQNIAEKERVEWEAELAAEQEVLKAEWEAAFQEYDQTQAAAEEEAELAAAIYNHMQAQNKKPVRQKGKQ